MADKVPLVFRIFQLLRVYSARVLFSSSLFAIQQKQETCIVGTQHNLSTTLCELVGMYIHTYIYADDNSSSYSASAACVVWAL